MTEKTTQYTLLPPSLLSPLNKKSSNGQVLLKRGGVIFAQETIDSTRDL